MKRLLGRWLCSPAGRYWRNTAGSIALAFGVSLPVLMGAVGMSLDMGQAYLVRQRLATALDASALAGAAMATEEDEIREKVEKFFAMNYPPEKIGTTYDLEVSVEGDEVIVTASADFDTNFMRILGIDTFSVDEETIVVREVRGLEVALVLDITGSMGTDMGGGYTRIQALRDAASSFVEILFSRTQDPENVKIGLVPYSTSVNVGSYGVGKNPDGSDWEDGPDVGRGFVTDMNGTPLTWSNYTTSTSSTTRWFGCVVEENDDGWDVTSGDNDPYPNDVVSLRVAGEDTGDGIDVTDHEGPWPYYMYESWQRSTACTSAPDRQSCGWSGSTYRCYCHLRYNPPSQNCPRSRVVPLTSDEDALLASINGYSAYGNTMGNIGMLWGYRLLSPEFPFQQGAAWGDTNWRKVIILMTDGVNTMDSNYSALWRTRAHNLDANDLDDRLEETCAGVKNIHGVLVYTITFDDGVDDATKDIYRRCATTPAQYYDAPSSDELIEVFETISRELANLHIRS